MSKVTEAEEAIEHEVVITDIDIPFWSMVTFMIKWAFASIPAGMIIGITVAIILSLFRS